MGQRRTRPAFHPARPEGDVLLGAESGFAVTIVANGEKAMALLDAAGAAAPILRRSPYSRGRVGNGRDKQDEDALRYTSRIF